MADLVLKLKRAIGLAPRPIELRQVDDPSAALPYAYWSDRTPLRLSLPVGMLRMAGGFAYGQDHPFVRALAEGPAALTAFYERFQPQTLLQMYDIDMPGARGGSLPPWELPWSMRSRRAPPPGEKGLAAGHGVSFYGPCTPQKVRLEHRRLTAAVASIRARGYAPDRYGDIEGQLLTDGRDVAFMVMGGKHRAAALAYLGHAHVPVRLRSWVMRLVDGRTAEAWPLVASGDVSCGLAQAILGRYVQGRSAVAEELIAVG